MFVFYLSAGVLTVMHLARRKIAPVIARKKRMDKVGIALLVLPTDIHITNVKKKHGKSLYKTGKEC